MWRFLFIYLFIFFFSFGFAESFKGTRRLDRICTKTNGNKQADSVFSLKQEKNVTIHSNPMKKTSHIYRYIYISNAHCTWISLFWLNLCITLSLSLNLMFALSVCSTHRITAYRCRLLCICMCLFICSLLNIIWQNSQFDVVVYSFI